MRLSSLAAAVLTTFLLSTAALANGRPIQIILTYVPGVSTTGPQAASGVAELVLAEGEVRVAATGLPRLDPPRHYEAWVLNTRSNEFLRLGSFNTAFTSGAARLDTVLAQPIAEKGWDLFLVTIEDTPEPATPSGEHSIAGTFPATGQEPVPNLLPNTGGPVPAQPTGGVGQPIWLPVAGLAALTLFLGAGAGYALGRRKE
jgi:hypothetical protein